MNQEIHSFAKSAKELSKNPLGIIALFIVLVYGFACLLFGFSAGSLQVNERAPIIWFVVLFPLAVLGLFGWLVSKHHDKLYAPTDYRDDESFLKTIAQKVLVTTESSKQVKELLEYGNDFEMVSEQVEVIEKDMKARGLSQDAQTIKVLVRQLAACQVVIWFAQTYQNIFGSQIVILKLAASENGIEETIAKKIFNESQQKFPGALDTWSFEQYMLYLFNSNLIQASGNCFIATTRGREFIKILSNSGYTSDKAL